VFILSAFVNREPVQKSEAAIYLRLKKFIVERVTVVQFRVDNRGSDGAGCFRINIRTDNGAHGYENSNT